MNLAGLRLHVMDERTCVAHVVGESTAGRGGRLVTVNTDIACRSDRDAEVRRLIASADLLVADGMPLVWASRLQRTPLPERVCGSNLIRSLSESAAEAGRSVFFLGGGTPQTAPKAAEILRHHHPTLRVAGTWYPPFGFEKDHKQIAQIATAIARAQPDIVFVALSFPKSEWLIHRLYRRYPQAWWIGVGISFSFVCGEVRRAPKWMQQLGLEWLHRLGQEPRRLVRRYLLHDVPYAARLFAQAAWRGARRRRGRGRDG